MPNGPVGRERGPFGIGTAHLIGSGWLYSLKMEYLYCREGVTLSTPAPTSRSVHDEGKGQAGNNQVKTDRAS